MKKSCEATQCVSVCVYVDCRPPVAGSGLPHGGRGRRLQCPANSRHAWHSLALLLLQLPLRPKSAATTTQAGVCRSHESQSCSSINEGVYFFVYTADFSWNVSESQNIPRFCKICASNTFSFIATASPCYSEIEILVFSAQCDYTSGPAITQK